MESHRLVNGIDGEGNSVITISSDHHLLQQRSRLSVLKSPSDSTAVDENWESSSCKFSSRVCLVYNKETHKIRFGLELFQVKTGQT